MTLTSYSFFEKYFGSEPATSARPPVLINGTASDVTNNTRFISVTPKSAVLSFAVHLRKPLVFSMYGHSPYLRSHSQIRCAFFRSASRKPLVFSMYGHSPYQPTEIRDTLCKHSIAYFCRLHCSLLTLIIPRYGGAENT